MRVLLFPSDLTGCGHYRMLWPAEVLRGDGSDVVELYPDEADGQMVDRHGDPVDVEVGVYWEDGHVVAVDHPGAEVVVVQRPTSRAWREMVPLLRAYGVRVVAEVDDDFRRVDRRHPLAGGVHPKRSPDNNWDHLEACCKEADAVVATTQALVDRYGFGHGVVVPNFVPARYLQYRPTVHEGVRVGWPGDVLTHPGDLDVLGGRLWAAAVRRAGGECWVVGPHPGSAFPDALATGPLTLVDWPQALAGLDVGLVPLADTPFNRAKSGLKMLELAACGVPAVGSPTPDNRRLAGLGCGTLAGTPAEWADTVTGLLRDARRREVWACEAREAARSQTVEANAWRFEAAWCG